MPICIIVPEAFSIPECDQIIEMGMHLDSSAGRVKNKGTNYGELDASVRECSLTWLPPENLSFDWIYGRLAKLMNFANKSWDFDLNGETEHIQFTHYLPGNFFDWHIDLGEKETSTRKLTCVIQLSKPDAYIGGDLQLNINNAKSVPRDCGTAIIFPTFVLHRVTNIEQGERFTLVSWANGKRSFR